MQEGHAIKNGLDVTEFRNFLSGGAIRHLSLDILKLWIDYMLTASETYAAWIAMDIYYSYLRIRGNQNSLPKEHVLRLLLHKSFFVPRQDGNQSTRVPEFAWTEIAKAFIKSHPEEGISLMDQMLEHLGDNNSVVFPDSSAIGNLSFDRNYQMFYG